MGTTNGMGADPSMPGPGKSYVPGAGWVYAGQQVPFVGNPADNGGNGMYTPTNAMPSTSPIAVPPPPPSVVQALANFKPYQIDYSKYGSAPQAGASYGRNPLTPFNMSGIAGAAHPMQQQPYQSASSIIGKLGQSAPVGARAASYMPVMGASNASQAPQPHARGGSIRGYAYGGSAGGNMNIQDGYDQRWRNPLENTWLGRQMSSAPSGPSGVPFQRQGMAPNPQDGLDVQNGGGGGNSISGGDGSPAAGNNGLANFMGQMGMKLLNGGRFAQGGLVRGPGGGQDDNQIRNVENGSFVVPADVVAHLGDGSNEEGAKKLHSLFHHPAMQKFANGGVVAKNEVVSPLGNTTIAISPGEFHVPRNMVTALGAGDHDAGTKKLYSMISRVRKQKGQKGHPPKAKPPEQYVNPLGGQDASSNPLGG